MEDPKGYYSVLGLQPGADIDKVKTAYRNATKKYHPDSGTESRKVKGIKDEAKRKEEFERLNDKMKLINEAKNILTDEEKKSEYDNPQQGFSFTDLFNMQRRQPKAKDTRVDIKINMADNYNGIKKKFKINRTVLCKTCDGKGGEDVQVCQQCHGTGMRQQQVRRGHSIQIFQTECGCDEGYVVKGNKCKGCFGKKYNKEEKIVEIDVKNVRHGEAQLFKGYGDEKRNCITGDIKFIFHINDRNFKRVGDSIVGTIKIDLTTCLLGGSIEYKHLDGKVYEIKVDKIKSFKDVLKVKGLGFANGDLYLNIEVDVPKVDAQKVVELFGRKDVKGDVRVKGTYETVQERDEQEEEENEEEMGTGHFGNIFNQFFGRF